MSDEIGDPIPSVFPPEDPTARFVVAMAMAKNDIERALRDVQDAIETSGQISLIAHVSASGTSSRRWRL